MCEAMMEVLQLIHGSHASNIRQAGSTQARQLDPANSFEHVINDCCK